MRGEAICRVIVFITLCSFGIGCINHAPSPPPHPDLLVAQHLHTLLNFWGGEGSPPKALHNAHFLSLLPQGPSLQRQGSAEHGVHVLRSDCVGQRPTEQAQPPPSSSSGRLLCCPQGEDGSVPIVPILGVGGKNPYMDLGESQPLGCIVEGALWKLLMGLGGEGVLTVFSLLFPSFGVGRSQGSLDPLRSKCKPSCQPAPPWDPTLLT